jgi:hypothetical protein
MALHGKGCCIDAMPLTGRLLLEPNTLVERINKFCDSSGDDGAAFYAFASIAEKLRRCTPI